MNRQVRIDCAKCSATIFLARERDMRATPKATALLLKQAVRSHGHGDEIRFFVGGEELQNQEDMQNDLWLQWQASYLKRAFGMGG